MPRPSYPKVALVYDYDGTLIRGNMQDYGLIQDLTRQANGETTSPAQFWKKFHPFLKQKDNGKPLEDAQYDDKVLAYLDCLLHNNRRHIINPTQSFQLTKKGLKSYGKKIDKAGYFPGVKEWFRSINEKGNQLGLTIEHYIVSAGHEEIIRGSRLATHFRKIYGCKFLYDAEGHPVGLSRFINYTAKTQYLFRICKNTDLEKVINQSISKADWRIPFGRLIYFGDGETDIPSMKLVRQKGGYSVAIYVPENQSSVNDLVAKPRRANIACLADYCLGKEIWTAVCARLSAIAEAYYGQRPQPHIQVAPSCV